MAKPEQTEKATPKRIRESRKRGQVPRSPDLSAAAIFLSIIISLHITFLPVMDMAAHAFAVAITHAGSRHDIDSVSVWGMFARVALSYVGVLLIAFSAATVIAIGVNILEFGFLFSPELLQPKFSKLNPLSGFQRIFFSPQTLVNLAKQLLKLAAVALIIYIEVKDRVPTFYALAHAAPRDIIITIEDLCFQIGIRFGLFLLALALADYLWERKRLFDSLKMTKTEVRDEQRQQEGNPENKQAMRNRQRTMARRRMMAAVPKATVVVTNPTHFAVALEWDELKMDAPVLTAKGADLMAKRIREMAKEYNIPIMENPPLARALYDKVELDSPVPPNLYSAVAQIIAFVYRLKNRTIA